jgi:proteasome lid subunit RPN8/RPN11
MTTAVLTLRPEHWQAICTDAESTYPDECCGIILGYLINERKIVVEVIPTTNAWSTEAVNLTNGDHVHSSGERYAIAPQVMLQAQKAARTRSLNIIGIYHSHPDHPAIPSECDRLYAWSEYSYIIVSVVDGKARGWQSWSLDEYHSFQAETMEINLTS